MASKLPGGLTERWNRLVLKIRKHHRREPDLEDFIMYTEEETMMSDPLFSREALSELNTVVKRPARRNKVKGFLTVSKRVPSLVVSDLHSETKSTWFKSGCQL